MICLALDQISDAAVIESMVDAIIAENPKQVAAYRGGKTKLQGFFVGQVGIFLSWKCFCKEFQRGKNYSAKCDWTFKRYMLFIGLKNYGGMLQVMKVSGGRVNPALLNKILLSKLNC